jgi:uncharacterized small protein (DUF1192 family)
MSSQRDINRIAALETRVTELVARVEVLIDEVARLKAERQPKKAA